MNQIQKIVRESTVTTSEDLSVRLGVDLESIKSVVKKVKEMDRISRLSNFRLPRR